MEIAIAARLRGRPLPEVSTGRMRRPGTIGALLAAALVGGVMLWMLAGARSRSHRPAPPPRPVARLSAGGSSTAVTSAGTVLGPARAAASLPEIPVTNEPATGTRLKNDRLRAYLAVLGAAPTPLLKAVSRIYRGPHGVTVKMLNGLLAYFGDASRPHAKWDAFAAVMASPAAAGATYIDLRLPERPAVGMPAGSQPSESETASVPGESTSAALAESLAKAITGGQPIESAGTETEEPPPPTVGQESESAEVSTPESAVPPGG